jgi:hypothetical protein
MVVVLSGVSGRMIYHMAAIYNRVDGFLGEALS